ncbi:hypothetical protein QN277_010551 [Acacia crassicarpa]|uniref:Uncharacterized protein n=1 Tax=Acacia crassicarpa TaxID=499986 RepID=A0AAE1ILX2_9FABA|nr:hypothetical protein QN277_010551 [Acacia crassicarpa]
MATKKMSQKFFDYRLKSCTPKSPIFYSISFIVIFFFVYAENIFSSSSILQTTNFTAQQSADELMLPQPDDHELIDQPSIDTFQLPPPEDEDDSVELTDPEQGVRMLPKENGEDQETEAEEEDDDPLIPPENVSKEERMVWFRRQLPELKIL